MSVDAAYRAQEALRAVYDDPTSTWMEKFGCLGNLLYLVRSLHASVDTEIQREHSAREPSQSPAPERSRT